MNNTKNFDSLKKNNRTRNRIIGQIMRKPTLCNGDDELVFKVPFIIIKSY